MNTTAYKPLTEAQKRDADSRETSWSLWAAILLAATDTRSADDIWEEPSQAEADVISAILRYWVATGQIDGESPIYWGVTKISID